MRPQRRQIGGIRGTESSVGWAIHLHIVSVSLKLSKTAMMTMQRMIYHLMPE